VTIQATTDINNTTRNATQYGSRSDEQFTFRFTTGLLTVNGKDWSMQGSIQCEID